MRSYCCCFGLGSVPATLRACAQLISIGRRHAAGARKGTQGCPSAFTTGCRRRGSGLHRTMHAPRSPLTACFSAQRHHSAHSESGMIVSGIVRAALRRAGIENPPSHGANLLRHTVATMMLRGGATLDEIGTVLRHKSPDTTAHYAKVDIAALQQIAQPWPKESRSC